MTSAQPQSGNSAPQLTSAAQLIQQAKDQAYAQQTFLQPLFELQGLHDPASLLSFLNLSEKGADTMIIHPGSHSIKFGLASQMQPFIAPNVIAYPRKNTKVVFEADETTKDREIERQQRFDSEIERVLPEIEHQLRKKRFLLIDAKSAKSIRNKQVSFKIFDDTNSLNEYNEVAEDTYAMTEQQIMQSDIHPNLDKHQFINLTDTTSAETSERPIFIGKEALALHKDEQYIMRYPIKYGDLNISQSYNIHECVEDLQNILQFSFRTYMRLQKKHLENFNCILIIPDIFVKHHLRYIITMLLGKMKFKSLFIHTESAMATFAMAMSGACVVDIGSSKINVCCIDEGLLVPKSIQRKHYGGDDLNEMLYRLINRSKALHYFPRYTMYSEYHYHQLLLEHLKENYALTEMDMGETVKTCMLRIKEKLNPRHRKCQQITFNCSDSLLLAPQSLFYSQMISILLKIREETENESEKTNKDPLTVAESFQDPEDLMFDIIQGMNQAASNPSGILKNQQSFAGNKNEDSNNTPSVSIQQDAQSDLGAGEDTVEIVGDKFMSQYRKMQEPMDLDEMICRSICSIDNVETRKKMANSIILIGGGSKIRKFTDSLEEAVMDRFTSGFDKEIERVNVELYNVQQHQQFLQHQALLKSTGQQVSDQVPDHLKIDPRFVSWMGASIIPKLESSKDMFIQRDRFCVDFRPYKENFQEQKQVQIQTTIDQLKNEIEEKKANDDILQLGGNSDSLIKDQVTKADKNNPEITLNSGQIDQIEKEVSRKLKKERIFEAGMKQVREKAPFHL